MTKKILLKWLEARKADALAQVDTQETAAKAALLAEKLERTKFAEMVAYVEPRLTEVYNYMMDWHKKNEELAGPLSMSWGTLTAIQAFWSVLAVGAVNGSITPMRARPTSAGNADRRSTGPSPKSIAGTVST